MVQWFSNVRLLEPRAVSPRVDTPQVDSRGETGWAFLEPSTLSPPLVADFHRLTGANTDTKVNGMSLISLESKVIARHRNWWCA
jgi:hypothetical protein